MHAVVVKVTINDREAAERALNEQLVPRVSQVPGFVAGSRSVVPDAMSLDDVEVREVAAHA
jgi:hypothetical protein